MKVIAFAFWAGLAAGWLPAAAAPLLVDSPDVKIRDSAVQNVEAVGVEPSVAVDPDDWRILLMSVIAPAGGAGWFSTDGGLQWQGDNEPANSSSNDPTVAILRGSPNRYLIQSVAPTLEQQAVWTDTPSGPWTPAAIALVSNPLDSTDKGFLCADNNPSSAYMVSSRSSRSFSIVGSVSIVSDLPDSEVLRCLPGSRSFALRLVCASFSAP